MKEASVEKWVLGLRTMDVMIERMKELDLSIAEQIAYVSSAARHSANKEEIHEKFVKIS